MSDVGTTVKAVKKIPILFSLENQCRLSLLVNRRKDEQKTSMLVKFDILYQQNRLVLALLITLRLALYSNCTCDNWALKNVTNKLEK